MSKQVRILMVVATMILSAVLFGAPARADTAQEMQNCQQTWGQMIFAGYYYTVNGTQYGVYKTYGQVAGPESACEDINVVPNVGAGYFMTSAYARTYMCSSSGSCWYNSWRWCGGGCVTATDMLNGTFYEVHIAFLSVGTDYLRMYD